MKDVSFLLFYGISMNFLNFSLNNLQFPCIKINTCDMIRQCSVFEISNCQKNGIVAEIFFVHKSIF